MQKTFIGEIIQSEKNEWTDALGELIECWAIALVTDEEHGQRFNVSKRDGNYPLVAAIKIGEKVKTTAEPAVRNNGTIKWRLVAIERLDAPKDEKTPF